MDVRIAPVNTKLFKDLTLQDGFGYPAPVIFFQGCNIHCEGCHNPDLQVVDGGTEVSCDKLIGAVNKYRDRYKAVVYQGGEPTLQLDALIYLMKRFSRLGLKNIVYTGHDWLMIKIMGIDKYADIIKHGAYGKQQYVWRKGEKKHEKFELS